MSIRPLNKSDDRTLSTPEFPAQGRSYRHRQLGRILLHLRDDLHLTHPELPMPTREMLDQLLANCPVECLQQREWQQVVISALRYLVGALDPVSGRADELLTTAQTALFPNRELFEPYDAYLFCSAMLAHLSYVDNE